MHSTPASPFECYLGKEVALRESRLEIVSQVVRGRMLFFLCRCPETEREFLLSVRELLDHLVE